MTGQEIHYCQDVSRDDSSKLFVNNNNSFIWSQMHIPIIKRVIMTAALGNTSWMWSKSSNLDKLLVHYNYSKLTTSLKMCKSLNLCQEGRVEVVATFCSKFAWTLLQKPSRTLVLYFLLLFRFGLLFFPHFIVFEVWMCGRGILIDPNNI